MKITKARLKQIIQEELQSLEEQGTPKQKKIRQIQSLPGLPGLRAAQAALDLARAQTEPGSGGTTTTGAELSVAEAEALVKQARRRMDDPSPTRRPSGSTKMGAAQARLARINAKKAAEKAAAGAKKTAQEQDDYGDWKKVQAMRDNPGEFSDPDIAPYIDPEVGHVYGRSASQTTFDPDHEYTDQALADAEFYDPLNPASASGRFGRKHADTKKGAKIPMDDEARAALGFAGELGKGIPDYMRAGDEAPAEQAPAKPARVARKGKGATRREINKMWKDGKIDKATWRKARRALANKGEAAARLALGGPVDSDRAKRAARDAAEKIFPSDKLAKLVGGDDKPEAPAVANPDIKKIDRYTKAFGELSRGDMPSDKAIQRRLIRMVRKYEEQGLDRDEAVETASGVLGSRLQNRVKRLKLKPDVEKMLAARERRAGEARAAQARLGGGATELAGVQDQPRSGAVAGGAGRPGGVKESIKKLTSLIAEEFKATLSENEDAKAAIIARLLKGKHAASYAGSPGKEAADLILQLPKGGREELINTVAATHSAEAIPKLKDAVDAQPKKPAEQSKVAKKPKPRTSHEKKTLQQARGRRKTYPRRQAGAGTGKPGGN